ncbi:DUF11 domain-containing protein [Acinetobacter boissieri]|uniref:Conserved repeat domain-containing protein n=1 Tax=Acinetobacter boissieri TaxID=1219383 RepID=A0A1G6GQ64_9GAMM|nr:DUF11 domain-containing protein [Acinetobacter boissieri]SDB84182.1 conserved repeat domain-containing protein [Acinetobacter boissieri]
MKALLSKNAVLRTTFVALIGLLFNCYSSLVFAQPKAGSSITNIASGDFYDDQGNLQVINSNAVVLTVQAIYALNLQSNQQNIATIGSKVSFPHVLVNTGNIADDYKFSLKQLTNDQFNLENMAVYIDRDQNGEPDDNNNLLNENTTLRLEADQFASIVVVGGVPSNVSENNLANFTLTATSQHNTNIAMTVSDTAKVVDDAVIQVTMAQSVSTGKVGTEITYTFSYANTGTAAARLVLKDILPADLSYQANSARWANGSGTLTDADDVEATSNTGIKYKASNGQIDVELGSIAPLSKGSVSFTVLVNANSAHKVSNTVSYQQYNSSNAVIKNALTNTVIFNVEQTLGVVLNSIASNANDDGEPNTGSSNLQSINNTFNGVAKEIQFDNYVWNTGQATDSYNLTMLQTNVPSCAVVRLYHADGRTLLTDTNGDGVIDTGGLAVGGFKKIKVGVYFPATCTSLNTMDFDLTATSVTDTSIKNSTRDRLVNTIVVGESDLYNSNNSGVGVGNVSGSSGQAQLAKTTAKGTNVVFPLVVKNSSAVVNNYNLYASSTNIDVSSPSTTFPLDWTVKFYNGDATCQSLQSEVTNTGNVASGAIKQYCAVVSVPENTNVSSLAIWFAIKSPMNAQGDSIKNQVDVAIRQLTLANDQQGRINIGGTVVYLHTLKNAGTLVEGDASGKVSLKVVPQNVDDGFSYVLYYDANNNGVLDETDPIATDLFVTGGLSPQKSVQLLLKVQAPVTATNGMSSIVSVIVSPTNTTQGILLSTVQNTDLTTVDPTQLRLTKEQTKDEACMLTNVQTATYSSTPLMIKPNQCLTYRLTIKNEGATQAAKTVINDVVPAYSILRSNLAPSVSKGIVTVSGGQISANIGVLAPQEQAILYFSIQVTP